jgi:hypothetical protein
VKDTTRLAQLDLQEEQRDLLRSPHKSGIHLARQQPPLQQG